MRIFPRQFRRAPFSLTASLIVLGIGIGGTTAAFSALYTVVLRPLPYSNPGQLVAVHSQFPKLQMDRLGVSPLDYLDLRRDRDLFSDAGAFYFLDLNRTGVQHAEKVNAVAATASLFTTLGVRPVLGRSFLPVEERSGGPHVVIISEGYWRSAFDHDTDVLHQSLELNGERYSIIGVMPQSFSFPNDVTQMWVPVVLKPKWLGHLGRQNVFLRMCARLRDGVSFERAAKRLNVISQRAAIANRGEYSVDLTGWKYFIVPLRQENNPSLQTWTWVLFWSVTILFLIVCLNVGGLLMLEFSERGLEMSVRLALGSSSLRLALQCVLETGLLCALGCAAGAFIASVAVRLLNLSEQFGELEISFPVLLFGLSLAVVAAIICCLYPLWRVLQATPLEAMSTAGHQRTASRNRQFGRRMIVVIQVAASTALLVIGGLVLHNYSSILQMPLGFNPDHVMTMQISLPPLRYASEASRRTFYDAVLDRIRHVPGIRDASACSVLPFGYGENIEPFAIAGQSKGAQRLASVNNVTTSFFRTLTIPLLTGKYFDPPGNSDHGYTAIIDRDFADRYFGHRDPLGQELQMGDRRFSIIGVVANIKVTGLDISETPMVYLNAEEMPRTDMSLIVKATSSKSVPEIVQSIVSEIDRDQPVYDVAALQARIDKSLKTRRFAAFLLGSFSVLGAIITAVGLYALLAYGILLRRQEFGIRSALGATSKNLGLLVMGYAMRLVLIGAAIGGGIAIAASRYVSSELSGIRAVDPLTWGCVAGMLAMIAVTASVLPAWRASHSDPAALLKTD